MVEDLEFHALQDEVEQLKEMLRHPDIDDAEHILREVYRHLDLPVPSFLDD